MHGSDSHREVLAPEDVIFGDLPGGSKSDFVVSHSLSNRQVTDKYAVNSALCSQEDLQEEIR